MSKAFTKETDTEQDDDAPEGAAALPVGAKNYVTPQGYRRMRDELTHLVKTERPEVVAVVSWAASNGDRSENGDYLYGKKRLREIDRRIRFLTKRTEIAEVVDPATQQGLESVFFGATVTYINGKGEELTVKIVGVDEVDPAKGHISWISPVARALLKAKEGDTVRLVTPAGPDELEVVEIRYVIE
ncbi:transcription elongation factor GreB [Limnobacter humi]|uniref:Transcription elongation factor GreB n=1 Tax=Limnobacter humi TaxID=1778671 RepID=A0ABT1WIL2_9BURK|nr:transcription elongation factor GreB [Limnobacter humi]MCQ8897350.1 transcription elongation factor GreB [Limnobacter humi]